jgi:hypothetical protein
MNFETLEIKIWNVILEITENELQQVLHNWNVSETTWHS